MIIEYVFNDLRHSLSVNVWAINWRFDSWRPQSGIHGSQLPFVWVWFGNWIAQLASLRYMGMGLYIYGIYAMVGGLRTEGVCWQDGQLCKSSWPANRLWPVSMLVVKV